VIDKAGSYTFTPVPDWNGTVPDITYTIDDGKGASNSTATAILRITVTPVVDIANDSSTTHVNVPVTTTVLGNDSFEGVPVITSTTSPTHGSITVNPDKTITFTPDHGWTGSDSYTYTVTSGGVTETATVTVTVSNASPIAHNDVRTTPEDTPVSGNILTGNPDGDVADTDPDGDALTVTQIVINGTTTPVPTTGTVSVSITGSGTLVIDKAGSYTFTPVPDWNGTVPDITYTIDDGKGASNSTATAILRITVTPVVDIANDHGRTPAGNPITIPVLGNDRFVNPDAKLTELTPPAHGVVNFSPDGRITYQPNPGFSGEDHYTYTVTSGGVTETAIVQVTVIPENPVFHTSPLWPSGSPGSTGVTFDEGQYSLLESTNSARRPVITQDSPVILDVGPFFAHERFDDVRRLPLPLHPIIFVNPEVLLIQQERALDDRSVYSDPRAMLSNETLLRSQTLGLGMDPNLFVTHAVRDSQRQAGILDDVVDGRYGRVHLTSDNILPDDGLFHERLLELRDLLKTRNGNHQDQARPVQRSATPRASIENGLRDESGLAQEKWEALSIGVRDAAQENHSNHRPLAAAFAPLARTAPSFSEQLQAGAKSLPLSRGKAA
jgi:hypothetical protein